MNTDYNMQFRQAAFDGNTAQMIALQQQHQIDINGVGSSTGQSAAHRATVHGHASALRLLYNLGANFSLSDSKGNTAKFYAKTQETKDFFALIEIAQQTLSKRNDLFKVALDLHNCSTETERKFYARREAITNQAELTKTILKNNFTKQLESELESLGTHLKSSEAMQTLLNNINPAHLHLQRWSVLLSNLQNTKPGDDGACNEFSLSAFVNLTQIMQVPFLVEETVLFAPSGANHSFVLLNRDSSHANNSIAGWHTALVIDTLKNIAFFYQFVGHVATDTCIKYAPLWRIMSATSSVDVSIPTELPLTTAFYQQQLAQLKQQTKAVYEKIIRDGHNLPFRQAAHEGNTALMIELRKKWPEIDVNDVGATSQQSAAHRAAISDQAASLRLLYNLGADFSLKDAKGKTAKVYAKTHETIDFFALIDIAQQALADRNAIYNEAIVSNDLSPEQRAQFEKQRATLEEQSVASRLVVRKPIVDQFNTELGSTPVTQTLLERVNAPLMHLFRWSDYIFYMQNRPQDGSGGCNEFALSCFVNLTQIKEVPFHVEEMGISNPFGQIHDFVLVNRDPSFAAANLSSWTSALVIDTWKNAAFFYQFANEVAYDTVIKKIQFFNITPVCSTIDVPFLKEFPLTAKVYEQQLAQVKQQATQTYKQLAGIK